MESVRNWLEQTIGMPIDYICIIIMGMLTLHVLIRIAIHGNMEFLKKYGKSGNDTTNLWKRRIKRDKCLRNACQ